MQFLHNLRPVLRATGLSRYAAHNHLAPFTFVHLKPSHVFRLANGLQQHRAVASLVSARPASQTISQAALNVREEVGNSTTDWAKVIAGGNVNADTVKVDRETFVSRLENGEASRLR